MKRLFLLAAISCFLVTAIGCTEREQVTTPAPEIEPAPIITPVQTPPTETTSTIETLVVEQFDNDIDGWIAYAAEGAVSEVALTSFGELMWSTRTGEVEAAVLMYDWPELGDADGLTIRLASVDRSAFLVLGVQEADGSAYNLGLFLDMGIYSEHTVPFTGFGLQVDSEDENKQLDTRQLTKLTIIDISSFIAAPGPNQVLIDEIALWKGKPDTSYLPCTDSTRPYPLEIFRIGVDANFIPQAEQLDHSFRVGKQKVDPLELFATNGANSFRLRLWVGEEGESKLDYATELAQRAQRAGLRPYLVMFLAEDWADVNKQPAPVAWAGLSLEERAEAIRQYAYETARHFMEQGINLDFYEIGNEIDHGICGIFADTSHPRDPASLREDIWPDEAKLIQAAIEGIREADPGACIMLHIACTWSPPFTLAFFKAMKDFGVEYDYMGLSYYPSAFGMIMASRLCETLNELSREIGKPVVIAETAYPAEQPTGGLFGDWRKALPEYPLTPAGQAWWLADFLDGIRERGDVIGVYIFSPDFWFSGELWGPFALFDSEGEARPAISSLKLD